MYSINKIPRIIIRNNILISKRFNINEILRIKEYIKEIDENKGDEQTLKYLKKYKYNDIQIIDILKYKESLKSNKNIE